MRLELADFPVKELAFGTQTRYQGGALTLNLEELKALVLEDNRIKDVRFEMVVPNEDCRITGMNYLVEPRVKVEGPGVVFPGVLGPVDTVGSGRTHRISNVAVVTSTSVPTTTRASASPLRSGSILDMKGPAAFAPISSGHVLVLLLELEPGWADEDYLDAIQVSELKVAKRLAEATAGLKSNDVRVYELATPKKPLPKVAYIAVFQPSFHGPQFGVRLYGFPVPGSFATLLHPNELLDGAVVSGTGGLGFSTWHWMNNPGVMELYQEHGKSVDFVGVILQPNRFHTHTYKQMSANHTAKMLHMMGINGAILPASGGGTNNFIDNALTVQALEKLGIKTVLMTAEFHGADGTGLPLIYFVPEAVSIVSVGSQEIPITLPSVKRVVGLDELLQDAVNPQSAKVDAHGEITTASRGGISHLGAGDIWGYRDETCYLY